MFKLIKKIGHNLLDLIFPIECLNCRAEGAYFCDTCLAKLQFNDEATLDILRANLRTPAINQVFIAGNYEDKLLQNLIIKYKYNFLQPLHRTLSSFLISAWKKIPQALILGGAYLVIPVPLVKKRLRWRGFNQAELLARDFSDYFKQTLCLDLKRKKPGKAQAELDEKTRLKNIEGVFNWSGGDLKEQTVLLIDDVITTGATLNEAARILRARGAKHIYALVLAKG